MDKDLKEKIENYCKDMAWKYGQPEETIQDILADLVQYDEEFNKVVTGMIEAELIQNDHFDDTLMAQRRIYEYK